MGLFRLFQNVFIYILILGLLTNASPTTITSNTKSQTKGSILTKVKSSIPSSTSISTSTSSSSDLRFLFTMADNSSYYNTNGEVGGQEVALRLDIVQPDLWVMANASYFDCELLFSFYSSEYSLYLTWSVYPSLVRTQPEYTATDCAANGVYATKTSAPSPLNPNIYNGQTYSIPYIDSIEADGVIWTDDILLNSTSGAAISLANFSFIDTSSSNVNTGGFGLAGNPKGSGLLYTLMDHGFIQSPGYSLWFSNTSKGYSVAELIPGAVDKSLIDGDFYVFDTLNHSGWRFDNEEQNDDLENIILPILSLADLYIENEKTSKTMSILTEFNLPVLLDTRSTYTYLPLDTIVNLAVQSGAIYLSDLELWLVECNKIQNSSATLNFNFTDINIKISISEFLSEYDYLTFSDGAKACVLRFLPEDFLGFSSLGLPFMNAIYMAMDNEGNKIGIGKAKDKVVYQNDYNLEDTTTLSSSSLKTENSTQTKSNTYDFISSGFIPFGTTANISSYPTLTYTTLNASDVSNLGIPTKLSASIKSSKIYTNNEESPTTTASLVSAAVQSSTTTKVAAAAGLKPPVKFDTNSRSFVTFGYGLIFSIVIICIGML